jgi:hypothetical protein
MIKKRLKLYPYHTFLVIPFIVLFLYVHNLGQTRPFMTFRTLWIGACVTVVFFLLFYLLFKNRLKTGVFVTFLLFAFFQYGVLYEFIEALYYKGFWPLKNVHRYLILLYLLTFFGLGWFFKKTKYDFIRINYFLNFLVFLLIAFNLAKINFMHLPYIKDPAENKALEEKIIFRNKANAPDIYYIILDGYASNLTLDKYYNFKNDVFTNTLKKMHFSFCDSAFSNYYFTSQSLSTTLNMNYPDEPDNNDERLYDNLLFKTLKENNYKIYHLYSGYAVTSDFLNKDSTIYIAGPKEFEKSLLRYTILRLDDLFGLFAYQRLTSQFKKMFELVKIKSTPKFCFMHFVAPHPPYIFTKDGKMRAKQQSAENAWESKDFYVEQLIYVNKQITKLVTEILRVNPKAAIVIQSDHGPWLSRKTREEVFDARSKILYAYYTNPQIEIPNKTSSVNTFRYLFNGLFDAQLPILPDRYAGKNILLNDPILTKKLNEH